MQKDKIVVRILVSCALVILVLTIFKMVNYSKNGTDDTVDKIIHENNEIIDINHDDETIRINNDEIVVSNFQIEFDEELNKWQVYFTVEKKETFAKENYDDYFIYFSDKEEKLLGFTFATMFNSLEIGTNNCVVNVDFDATLISKIVIKKKLG